MSRLDAKVDPVLDAKGVETPARHRRDRERMRRLRGVRAGCIAGPRWQALAARGARPQRPLWASTSTKDPKYPDVYYVEALIAEHTVNTLPPATFDAYKDHGKPAMRIREGMSAGPAQLSRLREAGIDLDEVTKTLEIEGVASFAKSYAELLGVIEMKAGALVG